MATIGSLLNEALVRIEKAPTANLAYHLAAHFGAPDGVDELPVFAKIPSIRPAKGEPWSKYRERVWQELRPIVDLASKTMGVDVQPLFAANSIQLTGSPDQIRHLAADPRIEIVELDPLVCATAMDDALLDIGAPVFRLNRPPGRGSGVRVAVLDSGVDEQHPYLNVQRSVSTCGEPTTIPGDHGTHCAGSIASQDSTYGGVAPDVELHNIKVLRANGSGQPTFITKGIDEALDGDAEVLSMSLGFNHLPRWSANGHGWVCPTGSCQLCTAVDNAVLLDGVVVVVAAANEHERAQNLRATGYGATFDTELGCPGQAREALTIGALTKRTFLPASFSSHGPTAYGSAKPDLAGPGVNITSTVPVPRDPQGVVVPNPPRSTLFARMSGTSMATPIVAGAVALLIERAKAAGGAWTPALIRRELLTRAVAPLPGVSPSIVGAGRLDLSIL